MASKHISLQSTFVEEDPTEWFQRFDICCRANEWDNDLKAKKLPTLLQGEALAIWLEMSEAEKAGHARSRGCHKDTVGPTPVRHWSTRTC